MNDDADLACTVTYDGVQYHVALDPIEASARIVEHLNRTRARIDVVELRPYAVRGGAESDFDPSNPTQWNPFLRLPLVDGSDAWLLLHDWSHVAVAGGGTKPPTP